MKYNFITIEGCIGSGKTTLSKLLAAEFNAKVILEEFENNPFLPKFYANPSQFAFALELFFMAERYKQIKDFSSGIDLFQRLTVTDYLFTKSLIFATITLKEDERLLFRRLFDIISSHLPVPQLIIYLHNSIPNLLYNISIRGRKYEENIKYDYLEKLQQAYLEYFRQQSNSIVLVVNTSIIDFVKSNEDFQDIKSLLEKDFEKGVHFINFR
jgi:deoxyguanosine kinase